jgi:acetyltransferase-like isoleucine patch superfamily enzyme
MISYLWAKFCKIARGAAVSSSHIDPTARVHGGTVFLHSRLERHAFVGYDCSIIHAHIGPFCSLASHITIGGAAHPLHFVSTSPVFLSHKDSVKAKFARHDYLPVVTTEVGADVWIGDGAYVKAGVTIGHGAAVGMGAVVTKNVPPYAVVAGNPARVIRYRFDEDTIRRLLATQWWMWPDARLHELGACMDDPQSFLLKAEAK